jgi:hypothetical protein
MAIFLLWVRAHQFLLEGSVALLIWVGMYVYYYQTFWAKIVKRNRAPRAWSVDMVTKTAGGKRKAPRH